MWIASAGHSSTQDSQSTHASASTTAMPSSILIASEGQTSTQVSQPVHLSASTTATIFKNLEESMPIKENKVSIVINEKMYYYSKIKHVVHRINGRTLSIDPSY